jgi:hypothetical protein
MTYLNILKKVRSINKRLTNKGYTSEQVIDFWDDVFKTCEERGIIKAKLPNTRCLHPNKSTVVVASVVNCETTVLQCDDCKMNLAEPKTDCQ